MSQQVANGEALDDLESRVVEEISIEEPWALLEEFSDLERVSGSADERKAAAYLTDRLEALGVAHERYDPELYISQPHDAELRALGREFEPGPTKTVSFAASGTVSGPVRDVGSAGGDLLGSDDDPHEPYHDVGDLTGDIALTAAGSLSIRAMNVLEAKGAAGIVAIHQHDREPHNGIATPVWGGAPRLDEKGKIPDVPIVNVNRPDGETLREWTKSEAGLELELSTDLTTDWMACPVVIAEIEAGAAETEDFALLHGHYDSWYVGVTDNATGDAGLLELARTLDAHADELQRNLRVAWWPGHSTGRYAGSTWYAQQFALDLAEHCIAHMNMDSPGAKDATEYTDMSCWAPEANDLAGGAIEDIAGASHAEHHPHRAGDYSFDNLGITGLFMLSSNIPTAERERRGYHAVGGCGGNSNAWHLSTDTTEKAGEAELLRDIRVYAVSLLRILNADVLPFDHAYAVRRLVEHVEAYDDAAGEDFDFEPTLAELHALAPEIEAFQDAARENRIDAQIANETITSLSRVLTRLNLVQRGPFEQDPAVSRDPIPRLAPAKKFPILEGDDVRFLRRQLQRQQNAIVRELREARELLPDIDA
jgi:hypothetical protein